MIVPYEAESYARDDARTILDKDTVAREITWTNMEPTTNTMFTTQCVYCGQMLLQTAAYGEPLVCEPCRMTTLAVEPVSLENLVGISQDYDDSRQGSINGDDAASSSACDDTQYEPEPEEDCCVYVACAYVDSLVCACDAAELYRYQWLMDCFACATTDVYEWKRSCNGEIWVGIDVCPYYFEGVPAQVPDRKSIWDHIPLVMKQRVS